MTTIIHAGSWVRGFVGCSRVRVGDLPEKERRGHAGEAVNSICYGDMLFDVFCKFRKGLEGGSEGWVSTPPKP